MYYTIGLFILHTFILLFRFHFLALLRQHPSHNCRLVIEDWDYYRWSWKMFLQLCDSIMDCPLHESGAGGEDEEDCDGEHFLKIWVTKYSSACVLYSRKRKWKWWWRHILKLPLLPLLPILPLLPLIWLRSRKKIVEGVNENESVECTNFWRYFVLYL